LGATNINAANYTDTNTQLSESDISTMGFTKDVEVDWTADQSPAVINAANYTDTNTTAHASFSQLDYASAGHTGFQATLSANQIIDWTSDQGATNIHSGNYTNTTYSAGDFAHNSLAGLNDGTSYEHITQTQKDTLHSAVTIGTANGLSLSTQALSMALSSTSTTGALSDTDWDTFNDKVSYTKTNVKGHINHGSTAGTARPSGFTSVEWIGTVEPSNAVNGDTFIDES